MRERFGRRSLLNSGDKTDRHFDNRALSQDFQKLDGEVTKWHMVGRDLVGARKESVFIPLRFGHSRGPSIEVGKNAAWGCKYPISSELNTEKKPAMSYFFDLGWLFPRSESDQASYQSCPPRFILKSLVSRLCMSGKCPAP